MAGRIKQTLNDFVHKWLRVPYHLHIRRIHRRKKAKATLLFIHGLGSTGAMWNKAIDALPETVNIVAVDLLGFGKSPNPYWETYNAKAQARSLLATYIKLRLRGPVIVIGHSLGALVAVEFARRYPLLVKTLILCSPPVYRPHDGLARFAPERILRRLYEQLSTQPKLVIRLYNLGRVAGIDPSLEVRENNVEMYVSSLRASILNQSAIDDIARLSVPIKLIHGRFDPLVIQSNLKKLADTYPSITLSAINASHAVTGIYVTKLISSIKDEL